MKSNPYSDDNYAKASEHLRLAISLLSKHEIPPSPMNFRLGYDYVAGKNEQLKASLDEIVTQADGLSSDRLWTTYKSFFVQDEEVLEAIRQELKRIIFSLKSEFERSGGSLSSYAQSLNRFAEILDDSPSPNAMAEETQKIIDDTRSMEQYQHRVESQMSGIMEEVSGLRHELEQIREESLTDALTAISNRKAFDAALEHFVLTSREQKASLCLLLADIDHFKQFNDVHGHLVGDKVLRFVASTLKRCLKGQDMAARYGGEEFAVILPHTAINGAKSIAEQIRVAISSGELKDMSNGSSYGKVTVSIGSAQFRWNELPNELIQRADQALYLAKQRGRNRVEQAK